MPLNSQLVPFLEDRAGDALRFVAEYNSVGYEIVYLNDKLDQTCVNERLGTIYSNLSGVKDESIDQHTMQSELGTRYATLQMHDRAVIINVPLEERGVLISLDPEVTRNISNFVVQCRQRLGQQSPSGP